MLKPVDFLKVEGIAREKILQTLLPVLIGAIAGKQKGSAKFPGIVQAGKYIAGSQVRMIIQIGCGFQNGWGETARCRGRKGIGGCRVCHP